jgi:hypothetical protein
MASDDDRMAHYTRLLHPDRSHHRVRPHFGLGRLPTGGPRQVRGIDVSRIERGHIAEVAAASRIAASYDGGGLNGPRLRSVSNVPPATEDI